LFYFITSRAEICAAGFVYAYFAFAFWWFVGIGGFFASVTNGDLSVGIATSTVLGIPFFSE